MENLQQPSQPPSVIREIAPSSFYNSIDQSHQIYDQQQHHHQQQQQQEHQEQEQHQQQQRQQQDQKLLLQKQNLAQLEKIKQQQQQQKRAQLNDSFIDKFVIDTDKQKEYHAYIRNYGIKQFLNNYLPSTVGKKQLAEIMLNLGYSKSHLQDYVILNNNEMVLILVKLLQENGSLNGENEEEDLDGSQKSTGVNSITANEILNQKIPTMDYDLQKFLQDLCLSTKILIITGAGISTSLGIPDFRSNQGLYTQLKKLNLSDPQLVFNYEMFKKTPELFYNNAHLVLPPDGQYTILHAFMRLIQDKGKLLRNYTQNIDNLESVVGIIKSKLIQCHGSFATATCLTCKSKFHGTKIYDHIRKKQVPRCSSCWSNIQEATIDYGVIKPDITFFGEDLPDVFHKKIPIDKNDCDLVIVCGTSLKVEPVASIIDEIPNKIPRILINKDPLPDRGFNLSLIGYCDEIVSFLAKILGSDWDIPHSDYNDRQNYQITNSLLYNTYYISKKD